MQVIETTFDGYRFRSRTEARWAVFFSTAGIRFLYEYEGFKLNGRPYLPDFWLPDIKFWFEVKGDEPTDEERSLCETLATESGFDVLLAVGPPEPRDQLIWFQARQPEEEGLVATGRWHFADDRRNDGEFWLLQDGGAHSIGPVVGPFHDHWPLVYSATRSAYEAARAARFEHGENGSQWRNSSTR
jgi:hypothetical protein